MRAFLKIEALEDRTLPAGIWLAAGVLHVQGTDDPDKAAVRFDTRGTADVHDDKVAATLVSPGLSTAVSVDRFLPDGVTWKVKSVLFEGYGGNDTYSDLDTYGDGSSPKLPATAYGGEGDDLLYGVDGAHRFLGQGGNDHVRGGDDSDFLSGGLGNDVIEDANGSATVIEWGGSFKLTNTSLTGNLGLGTDTLMNISAAQLYGSAFGDVMDASLFTAGLVLLSGGDGNDVLAGGARNDALSGGHGEDVLRGGFGADVLSGDAGNDFLDGGWDGQRDRLVGGPGADTFVQHRNWSGWVWLYEDLLEDFDPAGGDSVIIVSHF